MGYTHYWTVTRDLTDAEVEAITEDVRAIVAAAPCAIAGPHGTGAPIYGGEITLNGAEPDDYETFGLSRYKGWAFCKTGERPYDVVVTAALLAAKDRLGDGIRLSSDGDPADWHDGRMLVAKALGRIVAPVTFDEGE